MKKLSIAIIGAGICGSFCGHLLQQKGHEVFLFDKGRGVGGRTSTKRVKIDGSLTSHEIKYDHGASYFQIETPQIQNLCYDLASRNILRREEEYYIAAPGMNSLAKYFSKNLNLYTDTKVKTISNKFVTDENEKEYGPFDMIIVTIPAPQIPDILSETKDLLGQIKFSPRRTIMMTLGNDDKAPAHQDAEKLIHEDRKPERPNHNSVVYHMSRSWSESRINLDNTAALDAFLKKWDGDPDMIIHAQAHGWRYTHSTTTLGDQAEKTHHQFSENIIFAGDWIPPLSFQKTPEQTGIERALLSALSVSGEFV